MCLVVFLASDEPLPLIQWDESAPAFYVTDDDTQLEVVATQFTKSYRYYLGSDNGCGCGFRREHHEYVDDVGEIAATRENHRRLRDYIAESLMKQPSIELYSCWSGDEAMQVEYQRNVTIAELESEDFYFAERQLTTICGPSL